MSQEIYVKKILKSCVGCKYFAEHRRQCELKLCFQWSEEKQKYNDCPLQSLHDHDKELEAKVLESVKNEAYKDGFYDEDGNKIITYHINNYILDQIQKEFEDGK